MNAEPQKRGPEIEFHFHDDLASLVTKRGSGVVRHAVAYRASAKDAVEAQGVPHTEVGLLLFDGRVTDFTQTLTDVGRMDVYGWVLPEELPQEFRLLPPPPETPRFLLDVHLGRLAAYLRLLGFDSQYSPEDPGDGRMVERALAESRVLLTCDRGLLMRAAVQQGCLVRSRAPRRQVSEIVGRYNLRKNARPFTRCMSCNGGLTAAGVEQIKRESPPLVKLRYGTDPRHYKRCSQCGKLFWWGTHSDRMARLLEQWGISGKNSSPE